MGRVGLFQIGSGMILGCVLGLIRFYSGLGLGYLGHMTIHWPQMGQGCYNRSVGMLDLKIKYILPY